MPPGMEAPPLVIAPEDLRSLKRGGSLIVDDLHEQASLSKRLELLKEEGAGASRACRCWSAAGSSARSTSSRIARGPICRRTLR